MAVVFVIVLIPLALGVHVCRHGRKRDLLNYRLQVPAPSPPS